MDRSLRSLRFIAIVESDHLYDSDTPPVRGKVPQVVGLRVDVHRPQFRTVARHRIESGEDIRFRSGAGTAMAHKPGVPAAQRSVPYMTAVKIFSAAPVCRYAHQLDRRVGTPRRGVYQVENPVSIRGDHRRPGILRSGYNRLRGVLARNLPINSEMAAPVRFQNDCLAIRSPCRRMIPALFQGKAPGVWMASRQLPDRQHRRSSARWLF